MHSGEVDLFDGCVGIANRAGQIGTGGGHAEDAAPGSLETLRTELCTSVEHLDIFNLGSLDSDDRVAGSNLTWIAVCGEDYTN